MTEAEAARPVLRWFYDHRDDLDGRELRPSDLPGEYTAEGLHRLVTRLYRAGLIEVGFNGRDPAVPILAYGITPEGIDCIQRPAPPMTEREKLLSVLSTIEKGAVPAPSEGYETRRELYGVMQLAKTEGLIDATFSESGEPVACSITPRGRAVLQGQLGTLFDPPAPTHQTINVSGGYVQVGNYNTQNVDDRLQAIVDAVQGSDMGPEEKAGALKRLGSFLGSPGLGNALQGAGVLAQALGAR